MAQGAGLRNFASEYRAMVDSCSMYDSSIEPPELIDEGGIS
jgi:hypothetical protein